MMSENYTFDGQKPDEEITFVLKKHPWTMSKTAFKLILVIILLTILFIQFGLSWIFSYFFFPIFAFSIYFGYRAYFTWQNNLYILTNLRVIAVFQQGFFHRKVTEIYLNKITKVSHEVKGFWQTFLNYGSVYVIAEGNEEKSFVLEDISDSYKISQKINQAVEEYEKETRKIPKTILR